MTDLERALSFLQLGEMEVLGYLPYASNATLLSKLRHEDIEGLAVYKPVRGEAPLWDFPDATLYRREVCAWLVDRALGFGLVPPTVVRDGPAGPGSVQLFVDARADADPRDVLTTHPAEVRRMCAFDIVVNNADRKLGHLLIDTDDKLWAIDHGVCFHASSKLRTVIWAFEDEPLPSDVAEALDRVGSADTLRDALSVYLAPDEVAATLRRARKLAAAGRFPKPGDGRHVPWPPW